jgi:hypothetical protein
MFDRYVTVCHYVMYWFDGPFSILNYQKVVPPQKGPLIGLTSASRFLGSVLLSRTASHAKPKRCRNKINTSTENTVVSIKSINVGTPSSHPFIDRTFPYQPYISGYPHLWNHPFWKPGSLHLTILDQLHSAENRKKKHKNIHIHLVNNG